MKTDYQNVHDKKEVCSTQNFTTLFEFEKPREFLKAWSQVPGLTFRTNDFPEHLTEKVIEELNAKYEGLHEEFYTLTKLPVITPSNMTSWCDDVATLAEPLHFQEMHSGSGTLTLMVCGCGLNVAFPIDLRYGWDTNHEPHRRRLDELRVRFTWYVPCSTSWDHGAKMTPPQRLEEQRKEEASLTWMALRI